MTAMFNEGYGLARFGEGWRRLTTGNGAGREHTSAFRNQPDRRATCARAEFCHRNIFVLRRATLHLALGSRRSS